MNLSSCSPIFFSDDNNILLESSFSTCDKNNWPSQISLLRCVYEYRENLSEKNYDDTLQEFIILNEGTSLYPYFCSAGIPTVGVGLALIDKNTKKFNQVAIEAFNFINKNIFEFSSIENLIERKREIITQLEAKKMLSFVLDRLRVNIKNILNFFDQLPLNIQIALESLHYNSPIFIQGGFAKNLKLFVETQDERYLQDILWRICRNCNRGAPYCDSKTPLGNAWKGLQYRRYREMVMCSNQSIDKKFFPKMHAVFL